MKFMKLAIKNIWKKLWKKSKKKLKKVDTSTHKRRNVNGIYLHTGMVRYEQMRLRNNKVKERILKLAKNIAIKVVALFIAYIILQLVIGMYYGSIPTERSEAHNNMMEESCKKYE